MNNDRFRWTHLVSLVATCCLAACTAGYGDSSTQKPVAPTPSYPVGGTVTGLAGTGLVLQDDGTDNLTIQADGSFTFPARVSSGFPFNVTVLSQPVAADGSMQTCAVSGGAGTMGNAPVTSIAVVCASKTVATDTIGGSVAGLAGTGLILQNVDGSRIPITANGPFLVAAGVAPGTPYGITVVSPPVSPDQNCTVANGTGTTANADISSITVTCVTNMATPHTVGGRVTGLSGTGASIVLLNNQRDPITITGDGPFTFPAGIPSGSAYSVTAQTSGGAQSITCTLDSASGVIGTADVSNVSVTCRINTAAVFTVGGTVTGLNGTGVTLLIQDSQGGTVTVSADGPFTLPSAVASGATYSITAQSSSPNVTCTLTNSSSTVGTSSITNITVSCTSTGLFPIGGTVTGLAATGATLTLQDAAGGTATITADGAFTLPTRLPAGSAYNVTAAVSARNVSCTLANGTGVLTAAVTNITVTCAFSGSASVGGTVSGLSGTGTSLVLRNNGGDALTITADGPFTFATPVQVNTPYSVTAQANGTLTCTLGNASGQMGPGAVTNVTVSCAPATFYIPFLASTNAYFEGDAHYASSSSSSGSSSSGSPSSGGLYVVPAGNLAAAPAFTGSNPAASIGVVSHRVISGGVSTAAVPAAVLYFAQGQDQQYHVYSLTLTGSAAPTVTQLSSLGLASLDQVCGLQLDQGSRQDAGTAFLMVQLPGVDGCGTTGGLSQVIHITDTAATAPQTVGVNSAAFQSIFKSDGTRGGLVLLDAAGRTLCLYADESFTNPVTLLTDVTDVSTLKAVPARGVVYLIVATTNDSALYRVTAAGQISRVYTATGTFGETATVDDNNLYFADVQAGGTISIVQLPLAGGPSIVLNDFDGGFGNGYGLFAANNSTLIFDDNISYRSLPAGTLSTTPGVLVQHSNFYGAIPYVPAGGLAASTLLLDDLAALTVNGGSWRLFTGGSSSEVSLDGTLRQPATAGSLWLLSDSIQGTALQVQGITATDGSLGGGSLRVYNLAQGTFSASFTRPDGSPYTFPAGAVAAEGGFSWSNVSAAVGAGTLVDAVTGSLTGVAYDQGRRFVIPVTVPGLNVQAYLPGLVAP